MSEHRYTVLFEPAEEGGYVATCHALPGLVTEGDPLRKPAKWCATPSAAIWKAATKTACPFRKISNWLKSRSSQREGCSSAVAAQRRVDGKSRTAVLFLLQLFRRS